MSGGENTGGVRVNRGKRSGFDGVAVAFGVSIGGGDTVVGFGVAGVGVRPCSAGTRAATARLCTRNRVRVRGSVHVWASVRVRVRVRVQVRVSTSVNFSVSFVNVRVRVHVNVSARVSVEVKVGWPICSSGAFSLDN